MLRKGTCVAALSALAVLTASRHAGPSADHTQPNVEWRDQVLYHIMVRSFNDSDGDAHGDLAGIRSRLDYLETLGVTGILLTPLYPSPFYHNYFPDSFEGVDSVYGGLQEYQRLVDDLHRRNMKLIMDMEVQYVTGDHLWFRDSHGNPTSPYADYILYHDPSAALDPEPLWPGFLTLPMYDGRTADVATLNLASPALQQYMLDLFLFWVDPNGDGRFNDGVDGFRLDHIMDDLDRKGLQTGLFRNFWEPLLDSLRAVNPELLIVGEQADWGYGRDVLDASGANAVFGFPLAGAIRDLDAEAIREAADSTDRLLSPGEHVLLFIENHDMDRVASVLAGDTAAIRVAAALSLLLDGIPIIYYGQEIGMRGLRHEWGTDGNDIPIREAMDWYTEGEGPGYAAWYRDSGPWWDERYSQPDDGISVEEQLRDPESLLTLYQELIVLRKREPALRNGGTHVIGQEEEGVVAIRRGEGAGALLLIFNVSPEEREAVLPPEIRSFRISRWRNSPCPSAADEALLLPAYSWSVCSNIESN